jgi:hypothetical protein
MKKIILCFALLFVINSVAMAAPMLSEFPLGMTQKEAVAKGLIMQDEQGGILVTSFGDLDWPTAMVFENDKLIYLILKGSSEEFVSALDTGLWRIGWLVVYAATDNNLVFDAVKLASSGKNEFEIGDEYDTFLQIMTTQGFTNSHSVYISENVWSTFKQLRGENPVDKYPEAALCNVTIRGNDITAVFTTFGYMDKMNKQGGIK